MKILIPFAIGLYWFWQPACPYYFKQTYTANKPEPVHTAPWFDASGGFRPAGAR